MTKKAIIPIVSFIAFVLVATAIIFLAQGYRFQNNQIFSTGILVVTSTPTGATVRLNDVLSGATNTNINTLKPGTYSLSIAKEGYLDWTREVVIEKEKVLTIKALLAPINPSLAPITSTPAQNTSLSPDGQKLAYTVPSGTSAGVWVLDLSSQPFNLGRRPVQVAENTDTIAYSSAQLSWSPNSRDILMNIDTQGVVTSHLVSSDNPKQVTDITATVDQLRATWDKEAAANFKELTANFSQDIQQVIKDNQATIQWSPDNLKFLYRTEDDNQFTYHVYNKEKKKSFTTYQHSKDSLATVRWFADSEHLIILEKDSLEATTGTVSTIVMDGLNKQQLFGGTLAGDALFTYLNGSKLVILTSFNQQEPSFYLYSINLQ